MNRVVSAGLGTVFFQLVGVTAFVTEFQRIDSDRRLFEHLILAVIKEMLQPLLGADRHMIAGGRHNILVGLQIGMENHLARIGILDPKILRHFFLAEEIELGFHIVGEPVHTSCPLARI